MKTIALTINGEPVQALVEPRTHLADFLRDQQRLTGTHLGCEHGVCGACTVLFEGRTARSCLMLAVQANGKDVCTVEGLAPAGELNTLQSSFWDKHGLQCGYCTPGVLMTLTELLAQNAAPTDSEVREALSGHLCRCTGYQNIVAAALEAAARMRK